MIDIHSIIASMPNFSSALAVSMGAIGPGIGVGLVGGATLLAIARNPSIADKLQVTMIIALAFASAIAIYSLVVALLLKFVA